MVRIFNIFKRPAPPPTPTLDWRELRLQCINNIQYLDSYLRMLNAQIEDLKNRSARGSREKITQLTRLRDWMERKLAEEQTDRLHFESKLKKV